MNDFKKPKKQPLNIQRGWANNTGDTLYINEDKINIQGKSSNNAAPQIEIGSSTTPNLININAQSINIGTSNSTTNVLGTLLNNGNPISGGGTIIQPDWATENDDLHLLSINKDNIKLYNPTKSVATYIEIGTNEESKIDIRASNISLNANTHIDVKASDITVGNNTGTTNILGTLLNNGQKIGGGTDLTKLPVYIGASGTGNVKIVQCVIGTCYEEDVLMTLGSYSGNLTTNNTGISLRMGSVINDNSAILNIHPKDISIISKSPSSNVMMIDTDGIKMGCGDVTVNIGSQVVPPCDISLTKKYIDIHNDSSDPSISVFKLDTTIPLYGATIKNNEIRLGTSSKGAFYANYDPSGTSEIKLGSGTATDVWLADGSISVKMKYDSTAHTITFTDPMQGYSATIQLTK